MAYHECINFHPSDLGRNGGIGFFVGVNDQTIVGLNLCDICKGSVLFNGNVRRIWQVIKPSYGLHCCLNSKGFKVCKVILGRISRAYSKRACVPKPAVCRLHAKLRPPESVILAGLKIGRGTRSGKRYKKKHTLYLPSLARSPSQSHQWHLMEWLGTG